MPRKVLIVDDNAINRQMLAHTLCGDYDILEAENGREALEVIEREYRTLSAALMDIVMPEMDGYEVLRRVRDDVRFAQLPVIMVTGSEDEESRVKALTFGANDFILKPFNPEIVRHCLKNNIALRETASTLKAIQRDKLTGLFNREVFFEKASAMIAEHEPGYYILSSFDIDNFKLINDQYGSVEGDRILREIGRTVNEDMDFAHGIAGRISADNFAALLPAQFSELSITRIVRQNRMAFSDKQAVVFSVGRYLVSDLSLTASAIYDRAYIAKQSVKGRYDEHIAYFDDAMLQKLVRDQQIIADMDAAIAERQFEIWFQPQRNHATGALVGAEALVRWRHPEKGLIPPGDFIPIFEQNGFVYELDKYVWEEACRYLRKWLDEGRGPLPVSVNISRYDIFRPDFFPVLEGLLHKYGVPVELLRLEITESAFAKSTKTIVAIVRGLIEKGFTVEIDDFGSGYSSLNTLKSIPAQVLKLDMRFLEDDDGFERVGNILESIVRMAKWMGMSVIAEGVEDLRQADYLSSIGCDYVQGFLYARPMPAPDYEAYCSGIGKEERLLTMETVANLDNNAFWDPKSMDTLIFNSYVGAACIFEYYNRNIELLRVNTKFTAILGDGTMSVEDTLKLDWISCLTPESLVRVRDILHRSAETGDEYGAEYAFLNIPGGPPKTYLRATMRVIATAGKRMLVYCTSENVSAQRQAEENERRAEMENAVVADRLRAVMDNVDCGITAITYEGGEVKYLLLNDRYYEILGYSREQYAQIESFSPIYEEDRQRAIDTSRQVYLSGRPATIEFRALRRDGSLIWLQDSMTMTRFVGIDDPVQLSIFTDITAEKHAARELLDNMPGGAGLYEYADGRLSVIYLNKSYWQLVGRKPSEYAGIPAMAAVHPDDLGRVRLELESAVGQGRDMVCDFRLRHETEGYRPVHLIGRIVPKQNGKCTIYTSFTPISEETMSIQEMLPVALQSVMDFSSELSFVKGKDLRYISVSRKFALLAGKDDERELIGKGSSDVFSPELAARYDADDLAILRDGQPLVDFDVVFPAQGGARRLLFSKYPLLDTKGKTLGVYGTGRDVTETRKMRSRLELLTNNIPGGIAVYEGRPEALDKIRLCYFSDGLSRLFGYGREEYEKLAAENPLGLVFSEDVSKMRQRILSLVRDGAPLDYVYRTRVNGGETKWINVKAVMGEPNGANLSVNAVFFDVTEQRIALEKLRVSEEENSLAVRLGGNIICCFLIAERTLTLHPEVAASLGLPERIFNVPAEPVRLGLISPESADAYTGFFESILRGDAAATATFRQRYSGTYRWLEAKSLTVFSGDGQPVKAVISFADVTERLEKETVYKKWQQSMEDKEPKSYTLFRCNLNRNSSYDSAEGDLISFDFDRAGKDFDDRAQSYIRRSVFAEDRAAYAAFIDSNALLAGYYRGKRSGFLDYREMLPDGEYRWLRLTVELVEQSNSSDVEAYLLYEDIDKAKREELRTQQRAQTDPLTGVLNRTAFAQQVEQRIKVQKAGTQSALFIIDMDCFKQVNDSFGHAVGDETLIEMSQKLRESFHRQDLVARLGGDEFMVYMSEVSELSVIRERAALVCALLHKSFSVEVQLSSSVGISVCPDDGENFETLYRKADLALYHVKGTGKDNYAFYAEEMGDRRLPPEKPEEAETPEKPSYQAPKRRMLIVEDNELNRDFLTSLFDEEFIIDTAAEGTAALTKLRRYGSGISVVLLDLMMPGLDGFAVLRKMRQSLSMQSIPVIVVSGMNERETSLEAIRNGASDYITKPVDADLLKLRVASAISKAENEQLRARNRYLMIQNDEAKRLAEAKRHSEELSVALHAAERADLAKSQFLSSMSHEIRTPLNAIIGFNTIARGEMSGAKTDAERRQANMKVLDCLTKSEVASRHLLTIINDVLDMSAIESGKMKVDDSPFDFRSLISSLTVMFFSQARSKGVNFEVLFDKPTEEWFVGDQMRVNQILTNLLSNAVKFTPEGGNVTLTITENVIDEKSTGFCFVVSDTGIGMTKDYLGHIWTPFEQAEASISRRFGGTGLGLSITKNLVTLMNGSISVESESGVGSKFTVNLTLSRMKQPEKSAAGDFSDMNALVVDDDQSTCDYIKLLFDRCGANCMAFTSGRQAVEAFAAARERGKPFNICLIDWRMPQMDGFQTISEIRRIAAKALPIVVVTAYDFAEVSDQAEKLGISRFISKPLFQSSLFDLLVTVSGKQAPSAMEKSPSYDFEGARVLLVEDNNMNMEVARRILLSTGMAVDSAWNGQEACDIFAASRPGTYKAILMDVHMPEMDGYQATRMIRASEHPDANKIPIIAMTADVFADDIAEARSAGMNDHIAKPIDVDVLFKLLKTYMEGTDA